MQGSEHIGGRVRAPQPIGPLSGRRTAWRRFVSRATADVNRLLDLVLPGRWLHRRVQRGLEFTPVPVPLRRGGAGLDGLRIAFLSDVHAGSFMDADDLARIFGEVAAWKPDLVCLGGDLINTRDREIVLFRAALARLAPPLGVYAVPGNHDHFFGPDIELWKDFLARHDVVVLVNEGRRVVRDGASLWIAGVDDLTEGTPSMADALAGRAADEPVLLLSHHPDFFSESIFHEVDLTLSGHTHGGQVRLFGWAPITHSRLGYEAGHYRAGHSQLYVGRGVGVTFLPIRYGARPEIPILELRIDGLTGRRR